MITDVFTALGLALIIDHRRITTPHLAVLWAKRTDGWWDGLLIHARYYQKYKLKFLKSSHSVRQHYRFFYIFCYINLYKNFSKTTVQLLQYNNGWRYYLFSSKYETSAAPCKDVYTFTPLILPHSSTDHFGIFKDVVWKVPKGFVDI